MRYRALGQTGLTVSEIGFGAWGIGGTSRGSVSYGPTDDHDSLNALRRAFELGVTFYDTAALYGYGHSEELIGRAFKAVRSRVVIASKAGLSNQQGAQDFSPTHVRASLEGSLRRLQTDYLDVYQLHDPSVASVEHDERMLKTLQALQREGKIRAYGLSVRSPEDGLMAVRRLKAPCLQVNFNMTDQRARDNGLMQLCQRSRCGLIGRTPLCFGFLTGQYPGAGSFEPGDHRATWPAQQRSRWAGALEVFSSVLSRSAHTPTQLALRFCLSYDAVSTVIPGMLTAAHVEENVQASELGPLAQADRLSIERIAHEHQFWMAGRAPLKAHAQAAVATTEHQP